MPECMNCGHTFKTSSKDNRKSVKSCGKCTNQFDAEDIDSLIKDIMNF